MVLANNWKCVIEMVTEVMMMVMMITICREQRGREGDPDPTRVSNPPATVKAQVRFITAKYS